LQTGDGHIVAAENSSPLTPVRISSHPNRVDHFDEWKPREIRVARADARDPVFPHEDGGARVVNKIAREFGDRLSVEVYPAGII
jgi:hypothetical protein